MDPLRPGIKHTQLQNLPLGKIVHSLQPRSTKMVCPCNLLKAAWEAAINCRESWLCIYTASALLFYQALKITSTRPSCFCNLDGHTWLMNSQPMKWFMNSQTTVEIQVQLSYTAINIFLWNTCTSAILPAPLLSRMWGKKATRHSCLGCTAEFPRNHQRHDLNNAPPKHAQLPVLWPRY